MNFLKENITSILAIILIFLCFAIIFIAINIQICEQNKEIAMLILGSILSTLTTVVGYYFGSSKGSYDKNISIQKSLDERTNGKK